MGGLKEENRHKSKRVGRFEKNIDWSLVDTLLMSGCTGVEISSHFDLHPHTFYDRVVKEKGVSFTDYSFEKRAKGDSILRHTQFLKALGHSDKGDNTLLIWLGKNRLSQKESPAEATASEDLVKNFNSLMEQFSNLQASFKSSSSLQDGKY